MPNYYLYVFENINFVALFSFIVSFVFLFFGFFVFSKNSKILLNRLFLLLTISFWFWCFGYSFLSWSTEKSGAYFFNAFSSFGFCTLWTIAIHFYVELLNIKNKISKILISFSYLFSLFFLIAVLSGYSVPDDYKKIYFGWIDVPNSGNFVYIVYSVVLVVWMISSLFLSVFLLFKSKKSKNLNDKKQANIIFHSGWITMLLSILFNHVLPLLKFDIPAIGSILSGIWIGCVGFAITKYKFIRQPEEYAARSSMDNASEIIVITDLSYVITYGNKSFKKFFGFNERKSMVLMGIDIFSFINEKNQDSLFFDNDESKASFDPSKFVGEMSFLKDDEKRYFSVVVEWIVDRDNNVNIGFRFMFSDITTLKTQNEILEKKVAEKTKEIQDQLEITGVFAGSTVAEMARNKIDPRTMPPEDKDMAIMFSDIRGFTSISENLSPTEVINLLNTYFEDVGGAIEKNYGCDDESCRGEINKFIGDGIMAIFPNSDVAINAASMMMDKLYDFNLSSTSVAGLSMGIGINFGRVVYGNVGKKDRMERTVLGDPVNLSSRLESLTKYYGLPILISEEVKLSLKQEHALRFVDEVFIKGKKKPTKIFEVLDYREERFIDILKKAQKYYDQAYRMYFDGKFQEAFDLYSKIKSKIYAIGINDPVIDLYIQRCADLNHRKNSGLLNDWTGIFVLSEK